MTQTLTELTARVNDFLCAANLLTWDARTQMPPAGAATRGQQIATLKGQARELILSPDMRRVCDAALARTDGQPAENPDRAEALAVAAAIEHHTRLPARLLQAQAETAPVSQAAWAEARARSDFSIFLPWLERTVALAREQADCLGFTGHPYDPMLAGFEPGETAASLQSLFGRLRAGLRPILEAARARPQPRHDFLFRTYPEAGQRAFAHELATHLGYDFARGRLDTAVHPFEVSFTRQDVRITTRFTPDYIAASIFGTAHEVGHALYEQNVAPDFTRTAHATDLISLYAVGGTSFGAHESQSRLIEMHVARDPAFWALHFDRLAAHFPDQLSDVTAGEFAAAVNRTTPGLIRVEADEVSYDLHIMLRVEIEMALMDGSLKPADVPQAWAAAMARDLGVTVPDDARGCLQDVHWSSGYIGSFATYTIGNVMAAQIMAHLRESIPTLSEDLAAGRLEGLRSALADGIWRHGRSLSRDALLQRLTGRPLDPMPYLAHLTRRHAPELGTA
ncbi:carboxypeptidase M32 [Pararhodobacter sp. SW119]|uniref:carboxypeptidase M32 n=1 Tax=Pararhodobacter sp. SW119 TaxID=2780075 RepID=UPI001ADF2EFE|nr:carboxypeptidase M32 [Pararhodobacter sp. SW119]